LGPIGKNIQKKTSRRTTHNINIFKLLYYRWRKNNFLAPKLTTVLVKTPLGDPSGPYVEPYVIALVLHVNSFTKFGIRLDIPSIMFVALNLLDAGPRLTLEVTLDKLLKLGRVLEHVLMRRLLVGPDGKQL
jgi:hypothetical protein